MPSCVGFGRPVELAKAGIGIVCVSSASYKSMLKAKRGWQREGEWERGSSRREYGMA